MPFPHQIKRKATLNTNTKRTQVRQKYVHEQSKMESQRNVAYIKNRKKTQ